MSNIVQEKLLRCSIFGDRPAASAAAPTDVRTQQQHGLPCPAFADLQADTVNIQSRHRFTVPRRRVRRSAISAGLASRITKAPLTVNVLTETMAPITVLGPPYAKWRWIRRI